MAETFGLTSCPSGLVPKSKLLHSPKAQYGFMLKLSHHRGKNSKNQEQSQVYLNYAEVHPVFAGNCKNTALRAEKPLRKSFVWDK